MGKYCKAVVLVSIVGLLPTVAAAQKKRDAVPTLTPRQKLVPRLPQVDKKPPSAMGDVAVVSGGGAPTAAPPAPPLPPVPAPAASPPPPDNIGPLAPGEKEAIKDCKKYPSNKKFRWELRGEIDLMMLVNSIAPMMCRPFIVPASVRQSKVTIIAPDTMTAPEAYRMFLSSLESMGLTVQPEGRVLKIIESARARESAIPVYGDSDPPAQDQYVTRLLRLSFVSAEDMKGVLERLKSKDGEVSVYGPTNTLIITDLGTNLRKLEEVVRLLDVQMGGQKIFVIKLHSVAAKEMADMLTSVFGVTKAGAPAAKGPRLNLSTGSGQPATPPGGAPPTTPPAAGGHDSASGRASGSELAVSQIIPVERLNVIIVVASEKSFQPILALVKRIDQQTMKGDSPADRVHVIALENANAEDVAATMAGVGASVSRGGGSRPGAPGTPTPAPAGGSTGTQGAGGIFEGDVRIAADKPTNSLVVMASGRDYMTVRDLIRKLDIPRRQVFVEAVILEVSIDKSRKIGAGAHGGGTVFDGDKQSLLFGASVPSSEVNSFVFNPTTLTGLAAGLRGPPIPNAQQILGLPPGVSIPSFGVFLQAIQNNGDVNVVSMPHLLTTDNEKASIKVGQNLPFPGAATPGGGFGGVPGAAGGGGISGLGFFAPPVNRQDVALTLDITPHVNESDFVRMEIEADIQDVANPNFNGLGPSTSKRNVKSVVTVRDQQSIVIGGLIRDRVSEQIDKVPILGDIPILGYLFKRVNKTVVKQNLLIVLTPYVVKDPNDLRRIAERKLRERREFLERFSAFRDEHDYEAQVDYRRKRGLLEEINVSATAAEREVEEVRHAETQMMGREEDGELQVPYIVPERRSRLRPKKQVDPQPTQPIDDATPVTPMPGNALPPAPPPDNKPEASPPGTDATPVTSKRQRGRLMAASEEERTEPHIVLAEVAAEAPVPISWLGQILLKTAIITPAQLETALERQREDGGRLGEVLIRLGFVTDLQILGALGQQLDVPVQKDIRIEDCDTELATLVPINFAKQYRMMAIRRVGRAVEVAIADPLYVHAMDDIRRIVGAPIQPVLVPSDRIMEMINKVYARQEGGVDLDENDDEMAGEADELVDILDITDEAPIIRWVNSIMFQAVKERASDIHIEPREKELIVRYRVDGNLREAKRANRNYVNSILSRVKIMAGLNIAEKRLPQDGRIRRKIAGKDIDMRVASAPGVNGERITIRLLDRSSVLHDLQDIGFADDQLVVLNELIRRPHGIILVTGPTGSGKTTTLYACLAKINTPDLNILTVEDPVEYQLEGITQVPVDTKIELTFASVLRSYLRHDPDVIMVGEIRDSETAAMAIQASLTGHLVFSTVHTNDAAGGITRLVDMGIEPFLVASSLVALLAQRLVRRLCPDCRTLYRPTEEELMRIGIDPRAFFDGTLKFPVLRYRYPSPPRGMLYTARDNGCVKCAKAGYIGRLGIYELLLLDNEVRQLALKNTDSNTIKEAAVARGMRTLRGDGAAKVLHGVTTIEEVMMVTSEDAK